MHLKPMLVYRALKLIRHKDQLGVIFGYKTQIIKFGK